MGSDIKSTGSCIWHSTLPENEISPLLPSPNNEYDVSLIKDHLKLSWVGDFESLKCMVNDYLKLDGIWNSPGGEKKAFSGDGINIFWWKKKKYIQFEGANAAILNRKLMSVFTDENKSNTIINEPRNNRPQTVRHCTCTCNELSTDLEGLKLDIAIAEAKQNEANKHNNQAIDLVRLDVISIQRDFERIDRIVNNLTIAKITSDSNNAAKTLRLMNENKVLSSKVETLKSEPQKRENARVETEAAVESLANITKESNKENLNMETNQPAKQKALTKSSKTIQKSTIIKESKTKLNTRCNALKEKSKTKVALDDSFRSTNKEETSIQHTQNYQLPSPRRPFKLKGNVPFISNSLPKSSHATRVKCNQIHQDSRSLKSVISPFQKRQCQPRPPSRQNRSASDRKCPNRPRPARPYQLLFELQSDSTKRTVFLPLVGGVTL